MSKTEGNKIKFIPKAIVLVNSIKALEKVLK